jgi:hypothetical protein
MKCCSQQMVHRALAWATLHHDSARLTNTVLENVLQDTTGPTRPPSATFSALLQHCTAPRLASIDEASRNKCATPHSSAPFAEPNPRQPKGVDAGGAQTSMIHPLMHDVQRSTPPIRHGAHLQLKADVEDCQPIPKACALVSQRDDRSGPPTDAQGASP